MPEVQVQDRMLRGRAADERRAEALSVKQRAAYAALAVLVGAAVVALLRYAAGPDTYYMEGVSRWEHSRGWDDWIWFTASIALGIASVAGLVARALGLAARLSGSILALTIVAFLSFPVAWVAVTAGH